MRAKGYEADIATIYAETHPNEDGFSPMVIKGITYTEKKEAGKALLKACHDMTSPDFFSLGSYRGLSMDLSYDYLQKEYVLRLNGNVPVYLALGNDGNGNIQRIDNKMATLPEYRESALLRAADCREQLEKAKEQVNIPFPEEAELEEKTARLTELNAKLNLDDRAGNEIDDTDQSSTEPGKEKPEREER